MNTKFYHGTTKKMITAFATLFDNIVIDLANDKEITVPLHYSQGETFLYRIAKYNNDDTTIKPVALPVMGFELSSMNVDPDRHTNTLAKIQDRNLSAKREYMFNRLPVSFNFELYIAVKRMEDGLKIIEQIIPFFTPELVIRVKGIEELHQATNIPVTLTSWSHSIENQGPMNSGDIRSIVYQMSFTMKGFLYANIRKRQAIEEIIINMNDSDHDSKFEQITLNSLDLPNIEEDGE